MMESSKAAPCDDLWLISPFVSKPFRVVLKEYRLRKRMTAKQLGHDIGCCGSAYISGIERNLSHAISEDKVRQICKVLDIPYVDYFIYNTGRIPGFMQKFIVQDSRWLHAILLLIRDHVPTTEHKKDTFYKELRQFILK